jgi:hypothetical protein
LPWLTRQIPGLVALIDGAVLFTFCAVIFNVDLAHPQREPARTLAAIMLAVLASGVAYTWLALNGRRLKTFRSTLGEVCWHLVGATTWILVGLSLVLVGALSILMFDRVATALRDTGDPALAAAAVTLGTVFAVINAIANLCVIAVHAHDGSDAGDELRDLGRALRSYQKTVHRHRRAVLRAAGQLDRRRPESSSGNGSEAPDAEPDTDLTHLPQTPEDPFGRST